MSTSANRRYLIIGGVALLVILAIVAVVTGGLTGSGAASATHQTIDGCDLVARGNCDGHNFGNAFFSGAPVRDFSCVGCNFAGTTHNGTNWSGSDFSNTDWTGANLQSANFSRVNLTGATNLTQTQLDQTGACSGATLPAGLVCN